MIRHAAAVAIAIVLSPSWLCAQTAETAEFTVKIQSATVHKSPSTASPALGRAPRGTVLVVTRDLGSWVRVSWPDAEDGVGYVHQNAGSITNRATRDQRLSAAISAAPPTPQGTSTTTANAAAASTVADEPSMLTGATYIPPPTHTIGLGGLVGGSRAGEFGVTARVWSRKQFGIQLEASRSALTSDVAPGRVTSMLFAPSAIYSLRDHVTDNVWVRPYLGAGATLVRSTLKLDPTVPDALVSDTNFGMRTFGGAEVTFPSVPRFAVSADAGYRWSETPFPGFELGGFGFSISGHWYVK